MRPIGILEIGRTSTGGSSGYGGGTLDTQTVTSGTSGTGAAGNRRRGFVTGAIGSISDGTSNLYAGAAIRGLYSSEAGVGGGFDVILQITGVLANSGWTSINVGGTHVLTRAAATFSTAGGNSTWTWVGAGQLFSGTVIVGFD